MVRFLRTLGDPEVRLGYLNLTDDAKTTYGHLFPPHKTKFLVFDQNDSRSAAQMHNDNQVWGTLKEWYRSTGAQAGDTVVVMFDPAEALNGLQVLHLGLLTARERLDLRMGRRTSSQVRNSFTPRLLPSTSLNPLSPVVIWCRRTEYFATRR